MLQISHLYKNYGKFQAVRDLNLHVPKGDLFGFVTKRSRKDNNNPDGMRTYAADRRNHYDPWRGCPAASEGNQKADRLCAGFLWCV